MWSATATGAFGSRASVRVIGAMNASTVQTSASTARPLVEQPCFRAGAESGDVGVFSGTAQAYTPS